VVSLSEEHKERLMQAGGNTAAALKLLEGLFSQPVVTAKDVARITGLSVPATYSLIAKFGEMGLLTEISGRRWRRVYMYRPYIELFDDDLVRAPV